MDPALLAQKPQSDGQRPGFTSFKCKPLLYPRRCCRDFLVLATLDPSTLQIEADQDRGDRPRDCFFAVKLIRETSQLVVMLCEETVGPWPLSRSGLHGLSISRQSLNVPAVETARMVWSRRRLRVDPSYSLMVQARLETHKSISLGEALGLPGQEPQSHADWVMAMACVGLINLHFDGPLTPRTRLSAPKGIPAATVNS